MGQEPQSIWGKSWESPNKLPAGLNITRSSFYCTRETLQEVTPEQQQSMKTWATDQAAVIDALGVRMGAVQPEKNNWIKSNWATVLIIWCFIEVRVL